MALESGKETVVKNKFSAPESSYGEGFDALGIKPLESASTAGKIGFGVGQALGFFIPFSGINKVAKAGQYAAIGARNLSKVATSIGDDAARIAVNAGRGAEASLISSSVNKTISNYGKAGLLTKPNYNAVYKSTADEIMNFELLSEILSDFDVDIIYAENVLRCITI